MPPRKVLFLASANHDAGLTSMALGLARALQREGLSVAFSKPISQSPIGAGGTSDPSVAFARDLCKLPITGTLPLSRAKDLVAAGEMDGLMDEVVDLLDELNGDHDILVVEGLVAVETDTLALPVNAAMCRALGADLVPVVNANRPSADDIGDLVRRVARQFGNAEDSTDVDDGYAGILVNKVPEDTDPDELHGLMQADLGPNLPVLGTIPFDPSLYAPRLQEMIDALHLTVVNEGAMAAGRVSDVVVAARSVELVLPTLTNGSLLVTPGDRADICLAAALAFLNGTRLAGLLLTCGNCPDAIVTQTMKPAVEAGLPIFLSNDDTYHVAAQLAKLDCHVSADDSHQMERVINFIADRIDVSSLLTRIGTPTRPLLSPSAFRHQLVQLARGADRRIVLPEGEEPRTIAAAIKCAEKQIARCVLLGAPNRIAGKAAKLGLSLPSNLEIIDPASIRTRYVAPLLEMRKHKGLTLEQAQEQLEDTVVLGTMMVTEGHVDGLVSGAIHTTADTVRPALQLIKTQPGAGIVSSVFFMLMPTEVLIYGDCAINPDPSAQELATIAIQSAETAIAFGIEPRVAMISYSTGGSGTGSDVEKVRDATRLAQSLRPDLLIDGPMQYDAASVESVGRQKAPDSAVAGRANVFIFPDLNTGNTTYKAVQRSAGVISVGPMLQGLRKPVNDLSRGALVEDIVYTIALTAIQAGTQDAPAISAAQAV
ncbi:phosphate acetyltransferase [Aliiruegeria sabulilitoris]|uniref:phosphate acetyltransferase n=1 Tax=Aliiruegeria sabulilitoris TaxID=1510458 RepID=UPI00082B9E44|nr:phosphate acetyltransferase [Aliiruegeria sabulilitoris]NDR55194.1 phosphate acetyltransferase [Pseudoruegeria sp. M32A2M]